MFNIEFPIIAMPANIEFRDLEKTTIKIEMIITMQVHDEMSSMFTR